MRIEKDQIVSIAIVAVLGAAFVFAFWMPARGKSAKLDDRMDAAKAELGATDVAKEQLIALNAEVNSLQERVNGAQGYVPTDDEIAQVVRGINTSLKHHGVTEHEMVTRQTKDYADYSTIPVTVEFQSSFPVVFGALQQIEKMPRLIRVDRLGVQGDPDDPARPLEVQMQLSTFYSQSAGGGS